MDNNRSRILSRPFLNIIKVLTALVLCVFLVIWFSALPAPLFDDPYSTILMDKDGTLLSARIAKDEQWRFPEPDSLPLRFTEAIIVFEDKRFRSHPGIDPLAFARAIRSNIKAGHVVSGGSTLTMQLVRLARKGQPRTLSEKVVEAILALRVEMQYSKNEILTMYASHAPFGGNVVGLEAASWRYYGKSPDLLSWAESACLAVLPNSPALIHPGRGRQVLLEKRNRLLAKMVSEGIIDSVEGTLAILEDLPDAPYPLPDEAMHLLAYFNSNSNESHKVLSTLDRTLQREATEILEAHHGVLAQNGVFNGAILVMETQTGAVRAYVGNVPDPSMQHENAVDMIQAERSSGSLLKPLLYASAFQTGQLLPHMLIEDIPTSIGGYQPENFSRTYSGMVPVEEALIRSLNVPAVRVLRDYGLERFRRVLIDAGLSTIRFSSDHYGLPLILGGAEITLWDICGVYSSMGRTLSHAYALNHRYNTDDMRPPVAQVDRLVQLRSYPEDEPSIWNYGSIWTILEAMRNLHRPAEDGQWESFQSEKPIAWKTGTSYGSRDAWAIGVTPDFTVGVWVGNADGEGRPGIVGARSAAPIMFDVFRNLPGNSWWEAPYDDLVALATCPESGFIAGPNCPARDTAWTSPAGTRSRICPYHMRIYTDLSGESRHHLGCKEVEDLVPHSVFVLPAGAASYYRPGHPEYSDLPQSHAACSQGIQDRSQLVLVYPAQSTRIFVPRELNGTKSSAIFKAAHRSSSMRVYWYLDDHFIGSTFEHHTMELNPVPGKHRVIVVDESGERVERQFEVIGT